MSKYQSGSLTGINTPFLAGRKLQGLQLESPHYC